MSLRFLKRDPKLGREPARHREVHFAVKSLPDLSRWRLVGNDVLQSLHLWLASVEKVIPSL